MHGSKVIHTDFAGFAQKTEHAYLRRLDIPETLLRRVISEELTSRQRELLHDYYFGKMKIKDIAKSRGLAPSSVSRTLKRARANIFDALKYTINQ